MVEVFSDCGAVSRLEGAGGLSKEVAGISLLTLLAVFEADVLLLLVRPLVKGRDMPEADLVESKPEVIRLPHDRLGRVVPDLRSEGG